MLKNVCKIFFSFFVLVILVAVFVFPPFFANKYLMNYFSINLFTNDLEDRLQPKINDKDNTYRFADIKEIPDIAEQIQQNLQQIFSNFDRLSPFSKFGQEVIRYNIFIKNDERMSFDYQIDGDSTKVYNGNSYFIFGCEESFRYDSVKLIDDNVADYIKDFKTKCLESSDMKFRDDIIKTYEFITIKNLYLKGKFGVVFEPDQTTKIIGFLAILILWTGFLTYIFDKFFVYYVKFNNLLLNKIIKK